MFKTSKHLVRILTPFLAAKSAAPWTFFFHSGKLLKTLTIISQLTTLFRIEVVTIFRCNTHWNKKKEATSSHLNDIFQFSFPDRSQLVWECGIFMLWYSLFVSLICDCLLTSNVGYVYHSGSTCTESVPQSFLFYGLPCTGVFDQVLKIISPITWRNLSFIVINNALELYLISVWATCRFIKQVRLPGDFSNDTPHKNDFALCMHMYFSSVDNGELNRRVTWSFPAIFRC